MRNSILVLFYSVALLIVLQIFINYLIETKKTQEIKEKMLYEEPQSKHIQKAFSDPTQHRINILQQEHVVDPMREKLLDKINPFSQDAKEENFAQEMDQSMKIVPDPLALEIEKKETNKINTANEPEIMYPYFGELPEFKRANTQSPTKFPLFDELTKPSWEGLVPYNFSDLFPAAASFSEAFMD